MPKGVTPGPRQFTMMAPGGQLSSVANPVTPWNHQTVAGPGLGYFYTTQLDLRGLIVDDQSRGIAITNINLQEAGPWDIIGETGYFIIYDLLTTVNPTAHTLEEIFNTVAIPGQVPGFLAPFSIANQPSTEQTLNPSQVTWGMWRLIGNNPTFRLGGSDAAATVASSGLFGEGEIAVSPTLYWTRLIISDADGTGVNGASANLVVNGEVVELSTSREVSQMMRAGQR